MILSSAGWPQLSRMARTFEYEVGHDENEPVHVHYEARQDQNEGGEGQDPDPRDGSEPSEEPTIAECVGILRDKLVISCPIWRNIARMIAPGECQHHTYTQSETMLGHNGDVTLTRLMTSEAIIGELAVARPVEDVKATPGSYAASIITTAGTLAWRMAT